MSPGSLAIDLVRYSSLYSKKEQCASQLCKRSTAVYGILLYMSYLDLKHVKSGLKNDEQYTEIKKEKFVTFRPQSRKQSRKTSMFFASATATIKSMRLEHAFRAVVKQDEQGQVLNSKSNPEKPVSLQTKRMDATLWQLCFTTVVLVSIRFSYRSETFHISNAAEEIQITALFDELYKIIFA